MQWLWWPGQDLHKLQFSRKRDHIMIMIQHGYFSLHLPGRFIIVRYPEPISETSRERDAVITQDWSISISRSDFELVFFCSSCWVNSTANIAICRNLIYFACAGHIRKASKPLVVPDTVHSFGRRWFKTFHNKDRIWGAGLIETDVKLISTTAGSRERCGVRSSGSGQRRSRWGWNHPVVEKKDIWLFWLLNVFDFHLEYVFTSLQSLTHRQIGEFGDGQFRQFPSKTSSQERHSANAQGLARRTCWIWLFLLIHEICSIMVVRLMFATNAYKCLFCGTV